MIINFKSHFVRTNTPHPKELVKKKELLRQKNASCNNNEQYVEPSIKKNEFYDAPVMCGTSNLEEKADIIVNIDCEKRKNEQMELVNENKSTCDIESKEEEKIISNQDCLNSSRSSNVSFHEKHVGFSGPTDDDSTLNNGVCRLRRHDTPHHLKGARINNNKLHVAPDELKEILQRYTAPVSIQASSFGTSLENDVADFKLLSTDIAQKMSEKYIKILVTIKKQQGQGLGLSIAGGKVSKLDDGDTNIIITKLVPGGLASKHGLCVGDRILTVIIFYFYTVTNMKKCKIFKIYFPDHQYFNS